MRLVPRKFLRQPYRRHECETLGGDVHQPCAQGGVDYAGVIGFMMSDLFVLERVPTRPSWKAAGCSGRKQTGSTEEAGD